MQTTRVILHQPWHTMSLWMYLCAQVLGHNETSLGPLVLVNENCDTMPCKDILLHCGIGLERPTYDCDSQVPISFWPYTACPAQTN